jgi:hypothetical protein
MFQPRLRGAGLIRPVTVEVINETTPQCSQTMPIEIRIVARAKQ